MRSAMSNRSAAVVCLMALLLLPLSPAAATTFSVSFEFGGGLTADEQAVFTQAANYWNHIITGYSPGIAGIHGLVINVSASYIDGVGGLLGQTSPGGTRRYKTANGTTYWLPLDGDIALDGDDLADMYSKGYLYPAIVHEVAHSIGFGAIWDYYPGVYQDGSGQYKGAAGLAAYRSEFAGQKAAQYVPVELQGGASASDYHWAEALDGGSATGITDARGRDMQYELMTGWLNLPAAQAFVSQTTIHSFEDLGYTVLTLPDADLDGTVTWADLDTVLSHFNGSGMDWAQGDFDGNGTVNGADLTNVLGHYNQNLDLYGTFGPSGGLGGNLGLSMAIPEPGTLQLLGFAAAGLLAWAARRKRR